MTMSDFNPRPSDKLTASERKELDTSEFGIPQLREFPIHDAAHVRAAKPTSGMRPKSIKRSWHGISWPKHICWE